MPIRMSDCCATARRIWFPGTHGAARLAIALTGMREPGEQVGGCRMCSSVPLAGYGLVVDRSSKRCARRRMDARSCRGIIPQLKREAVLIEDATESFAKEVDPWCVGTVRSFPRCGTSKSGVADVAMDLYAMCAWRERRWH